MDTLSEYEFVKCEDGVYFGKILKNGKLSKNARKIEDSEILALFEDYLKEYCAKHLTNFMTIGHRDSESFYEAKLFVRD